MPVIDVTGSTPLQTFTLASGATTPFSASLSLGPTSSGLITALLSQYTGPGTFDALLSTLTGLTLIGGGGNIDATQSTNATGQIDVTYDFLNAATSQTPLPAALPMFVGGLGALGSARLAQEAEGTSSSVIANFLWQGRAAALAVFLFAPIILQRMSPLLARCCVRCTAIVSVVIGLPTNVVARAEFLGRD